MRVESHGRPSESSRAALEDTLSDGECATEMQQLANVVVRGVSAAASNLSAAPIRG